VTGFGKIMTKGKVRYFFIMTSKTKKLREVMREPTVQTFLLRIVLIYRRKTILLIKIVYMNIGSIGIRIIRNFIQFYYNLNIFFNISSTSIFYLIKIIN